MNILHYTLLPGQAFATVPINLPSPPSNAAVFGIRIPPGAVPEDILSGVVKGELSPTGIDVVLSSAPTQTGYVLTLAYWE